MPRYRLAWTEEAEPTWEASSGSMSGPGSAHKLTGQETAAIIVTCERFIAKVLKLRFLTEIWPTSFNHPVAVTDMLGCQYRRAVAVRAGSPGCVPRVRSQPTMFRMT
jgi:hypothetical protein